MADLTAPRASDVVPPKDEHYRQCLSHLEAGQLELAARLMCAYEASLSDQRGIGCDWGNPAFVVDQVRMFKRFFTITPAILGPLSDDVWHDLRVRACMLEVMGAGSVPLRFGLQKHHVGVMNADAAARMIIYAEAHEREVAGWRETGVVVGASISAAGDSCEFCQQRDGERFALDAIPDLPHWQCSHKMGCRCNATAILDIDP